MILNCTKCGADKPEDEFHAEKRNTQRNGKRTWCKACDYKRARIYSQANKESISAKTLEYRRQKHRFFEPGMFDQRLAEQGGLCAICKTDTPGGRGKFHADHDHNTNTPRGALCHNCNVALGNFQDNPEILQAAIEYLKKYTEE